MARSAVCGLKQSLAAVLVIAALSACESDDTEWGAAARTDLAPSGRTVQPAPAQIEITPDNLLSFIRLQSTGKGAGSPFAIRLPSAINSLDMSLRLDPRPYLPPGERKPFLFLLSTNRYSEEEATNGLYRYDVLIVDPEPVPTMRRFPLWQIESKVHLPSVSSINPILGMIDERKLAYIEARREDNGDFSFHLQTVDIYTGDKHVVFPDFYRVDGADDDEAFLPPIRSSSDAADFFINTRKGKLWSVHFAQGKLIELNDSFLPSGDPGSRPLRTNVYTSHDLERFVYEDTAVYRFYKKDGTLLQTIEKASLGAFQDSPAFIWSPNGTYAAIHYTNAADPEYSAIFDDRWYVKSDGISLFDRDGRRIRTIGLEPDGKRKLMLHGFIYQDTEMVLEHYGEPDEISESSFVLYDVNTGRSTRLEEAASMEQGTSWEEVELAYLPSIMRHAALYIDRQNNLLWKAPSSWRRVGLRETNIRSASRPAVFESLMAETNRTDNRESIGAALYGRRPDTHAWELVGGEELMTFNPESMVGVVYPWVVYFDPGNLSMGDGLHFVKLADEMPADASRSVKSEALP